MYRTICTILRYDTIQFIRYAHFIERFMSTYDTPIRYETFYTRFNTYRVSYDIDNYAWEHYGAAVN